MFWVEHDGIPVPRRIGGHVALDFCNTYAGWNDGRGGDWLTGYDVWLAWAAYAELVDEDGVARLRRLARRDPGAAEETLRDLRTLRRSVHAAMLDPSDSRHLAVVSRAVRTSAAFADLRPSDDGVARWEVRRTAGLALPTHLVARAAADLLTGPEAAQVRACPGEGCGWLFLDRRGRRRWCVMEVCGNRAKARAYAERHR